jgi:hypothetical protein
MEGHMLWSRTVEPSQGEDMTQFQERELETRLNQTIDTLTPSEVSNSVVAAESASGINSLLTSVIAIIILNHKVPLATSGLSNSELSLPLIDESSDVNTMFHLKQMSTLNSKGYQKPASLQ